jgi:hypothetical protein
LTDILEAEGEQKEATKDRIAALKVVNDMLGFNSPVKTETKHEGGVTVNLGKGTKPK